MPFACMTQNPLKLHQIIMLSYIFERDAEQKKNHEFHHRIISNTKINSTESMNQFEF